MLTLDQLKSIMPRMANNPKTASKYLPLLNAAMNEAQINTKSRIAAFLAQVAHESGEFRFMEEIWGPTSQQLRYEPPSTLSNKLGNTQPGDGFRYKGRGPIQLTGRANYKECGLALNLDLVNHPELVATPECAFRVACWYWTKHKLNSLADASKFDDITRSINGGLTGKVERDRYYTTALAKL